MEYPCSAAAPSFRSADGWRILQVWLLLGMLGAAEWQWSVPDGQARAYLWIPPTCSHVRGALVANHNMIEQGILEHPAMRRTLAALDFAEVWVVPALDASFDFHHGAGEHFQSIVDHLAEVSGYEELRRAPVVPIGHSACATYPWNFAAWNPQRTLAVLSVHGDAPQTTLTGNGKPRLEWGERSIDGIPGLMVMGEFEWWEDRLKPALQFAASHPQTPLAMLADAGHGHFDFSDDLVEYLALFVRKAAAARLTDTVGADGVVQLRAVDPRQGWRADRWHPDAAPTTVAAPYADYAGDAAQSFWCFDGEMAAAGEAIYAKARGRQPQLLSVTADDGSDPQAGCGEPVTPAFIAQADGLTFTLRTAFVATVPGSPANTNPARWAKLPVGTPLGHAAGGGPIRLSPIVGPLRQVGPQTFTVQLGRAEYTENSRNHDLWLVASHPGDEQFKSAVQQVRIAIPRMTSGIAQTITFPALADQPRGTSSLTLAAVSNAGLPVHYYLREGPAEIEGNTLRFTALPPRSRLPLAVTVVAWQLGRGGEHPVQAAPAVERTFYLTP